MILVVFKAQISAGMNNLAAGIRGMFGASSPTTTPPVVTQPLVQVPSVSNTASEAQVSQGILDKIVPSGHKEVFNISTNDYSFYDAEPLCHALGAELATYTQVKESWEKGADWCNYGWVKGQAAVYPTQKETWDKLQHGPEDERDACGTPGVNGGYFDNPEMKFGVNCYGNKPDQSSNDEKNMMAHGTIPRTASTLKFDQQVEEYKETIDRVGVLPFNRSTWSN
jgi:hypothetical protein